MDTRENRPLSAWDWKGKMSDRGSLAAAATGKRERPGGAVSRHCRQDPIGLGARQYIVPRVDQWRTYAVHAVQDHTYLLCLLIGDLTSHGRRLTQYRNLTS
jgi:hypothetical protein